MTIRNVKKVPLVDENREEKDLCYILLKLASAFKFKLKPIF